jgi:hypothetical protein
MLESKGCEPRGYCRVSLDAWLIVRSTVSEHVLSIQSGASNHVLFVPSTRMPSRAVLAAAACKTAGTGNDRP